MDQIVRVSSGWGFAHSFTVEEFQKLADISHGLEFSLTNHNRYNFLKEADLTLQTASAHLQSNEKNVKDYWDLEELYSIDTVVVHAVKDGEVIENLQSRISSPPLTFENLDGSSEDSKEALEFTLNRPGTKFTIDIQHLLENYSVSKAKSLLDKELRTRVVQFHISGRNEDDKHSLVINASNKTEVVSLLEFISSHRTLSSVPWVIEGHYHSIEEAKEEIEFLKQFE
jgi:uncharacterized protein (UPF0276 family)